jgi:anti-anti-sigma factor
MAQTFLGLPPVLGAVFGKAVAMADSLSCRLASADGCRVLLLEGEVDMSSAPTFVQALAECDGAEHLVVDLSAVGYIDSSGLHALERAREQFEHRGGRLTLRAPSLPVAAALRASELADYFHIDAAEVRPSG